MNLAENAIGGNTTFNYSMTRPGTNRSAFFAKYTSLINSAPANFSLSSTSIFENREINTVIGTFSTIDPGDVSNSYTYTLVNGIGSADNSSFNIVGNQLRSSSVFNFFTKSAYNIRVRSMDFGGLWFERNFTITIERDPALTTNTFASLTFQNTIDSTS
jgi:hypothetical protein